MINEEIEMEPCLALLRFGDGLKGHERRSVGAVVAPLDRHVRASGRPGKAKVDVELREFLFGKSPHVYRVIFLIDGDTARVLDRC